MIDDVLEPSLPTPPARPRRVKIAVAATALAAVLTGGLAVATSGDNEPEPLALVAGAQGDAQNERAAAPAVAPLAAGDSKLAIDAPAYWGGIEYQVNGDLPDLGDKAMAWRVNTPDLDRETVARWADALGLSGTPQLRDGAWVVETPEATLSAYPGDGWSVSFNRNPGDRRSGAVSPADGERQARALLDRLGVLEGEWRVQAFETEIGFGYACAEAIKLREEETARLDPDAAVSSNSGAAVSSDPVAPGSEPVPMPDCPPPAPPVKAQNVSFFPVVGGTRVEWGVWNVTVGPEGVENLYGTWVTFAEGDEYKLRSVDAALEELRQGGRAVPMPAPLPAPMPMPTDAVPPTEPATDPAIDSVGSPGGGTSGSAGVAARPAIGAYPYPCPPEADCVAPEPQVVTITGVELTLLPNSVYTDGASRLYLVPAYRFTGTFEGGAPWETTVIALHPDAIATPPPVAVDGQAPVEGTEVAPAKPPAG